MPWVDDPCMPCLSSVRGRVKKKESTLCFFRGERNELPILFELLFFCSERKKAIKKKTVPEFLNFCACWLLLKSSLPLCLFYFLLPLSLFSLDFRKQFFSIAAFTTGTLIFLNFVPFYFDLPGREQRRTNPKIQGESLGRGRFSQWEKVAFPSGRIEREFRSLRANWRSFDERNYIHTYIYIYIHIYIYIYTHLLSF